MGLAAKIAASQNAAPVVQPVAPAPVAAPVVNTYVAPTMSGGPEPSAQGLQLVPPAGQAPVAATPTQAPAMPPMITAQGKYYPYILQKMQTIVADKKLEGFYPPARLAAVAADVSSRVDFDALAARWHLPTEIAADLASLALYNVMIYADDSGSMSTEGRWDDLKMVFEKVSEIGAMLDSDGIDIRFMNSNVSGDSINSPQKLNDMLKGVSPGGMTPLGSNMERKILSSYRAYTGAPGNMSDKKPMLVITITDGEPSDGRDTMKKTIVNMQKSLEAMHYPKMSVSYMFAQVGTDKGAEDYLQELDTDKVIGDSIDCVSGYEAEQAQFMKKNKMDLTPEMYLVKLMVGGIDRSYDEGDE